MAILVTGGAGYIGSHAAKAVRAAGMEPVVLDNLSAGHREAVQWGPFVEGDISDRELVRDLIRAYRIDGVIHFAADASVGESVVEPRKYFQNNAIGTLQLLDAVLDSGVRHFVFASSCASYGLPRMLPIPETHPQVPVNPYGESKLWMERTLKWYGEAYGLNWIALRFFNAAGADPGGSIGEDHHPETHLIPLAIQAALGERGSVAVLGTEYPTPDGTAIRDYVHVCDLAAAHVSALRHLRKHGGGAAFNLGTGKGYTVREVIRAVERNTGQTVRVRESAARPGDPPMLVADSALAAKVLGWIPRHSSLDLIVQTAWQWHARARAVA